MRGHTLGPPHASGLAPVQEAVRQRQLEHAQRAGWPRLELADLAFRRFGTIEHTPTGRLYKAHRGELGEPLYAVATAYYLTGSGAIVFIEDPPAGSPRTTADLEQRRVQREQRRAVQQAAKGRRWRR